MEMIELERKAFENGYSVYTDKEEKILVTIKSENPCDIDKSLIVINKNDLERLLKNPKMGVDLPIGTKVMVKDEDNYDYTNWLLMIYAGNRSCCSLEDKKMEDPEVFSYIIPCVIFDYNDPNRWIETSFDYGLNGRALNW